MAMIDDLSLTGMTFSWGQAVQGSEIGSAETQRTNGVTDLRCPHKDWFLRICEKNCHDAAPLLIAYFLAVLENGIAYCKVQTDVAYIGISAITRRLLQDW